MAERGVCCYCDGDCNPASQACGSCFRKFNILGGEYIPVPEIEIPYKNVVNAISEQLKLIKAKPNSVIVYDIDGTLLDETGAIQSIVDTYHQAKSAGFKTAIITARRDYTQNVINTISQLGSIGVTNFSHIYFLPSKKQNITKFKFQSRQHLHELGLEVVMSIGDMPWDVGAYGGVGFLVK